MTVLYQRVSSWLNYFIRIKNLITFSLISILYGIFICYISIWHLLLFHYHFVKYLCLLYLSAIIYFINTINFEKKSIFITFIFYIEFCLFKIVFYKVFCYIQVIYCRYFILLHLHYKNILFIKLTSFMYLYIYYISIL